jgi:hypothetical protein
MDEKRYTDTLYYTRYAENKVVAFNLDGEPIDQDEATVIGAVRLYHRLKEKGFKQVSRPS